MSDDDVDSGEFCRCHRPLLALVDVRGIASCNVCGLPITDETYRLHGIELRDTPKAP